MNSLDHATSRELELEQVRRAIVRADADIWRIESELASMRRKQIRRHREVARQETLAALANNSANSDKA